MRLNIKARLAKLEERRSIGLDPDHISVVDRTGAFPDLRLPPGWGLLRVEDSTKVYGRLPTDKKESE